MFAKFGFLLLILLFGVFAFIGGAMAPDAWQQSIAHIGNHLIDLMHTTSSISVISTDVACVTKPASAASASNQSHDTKCATKASDATGSAVPDSTPTTPAIAPVQLDALLVKTTVATPVPAKGQPVFALQLGQFVTDDEASIAEDHFKAQGLDLPLTKVAVIDSQNASWTVLAIGEFASPAAALQAAPRLQEALDLRSTPLIQLPPSPKPAS
jgi:cell division protein FtsN